MEHSFFPDDVPSRKCGFSGTPQVLDEDEYVAQIEAIVERDYFPDIPKLRSQLEWEQAVNTGDPFLIRPHVPSNIFQATIFKPHFPSHNSNLGTGVCFAPKAI
ncbi:hypothetical protein DUNSADRAFT_2509 [Dunaliella salina]|uniref:Encoded protein n=1 Tax=Dunaliella salina TaxID=3046 RepID=A0ABQ7GVI0_DUNSA|nr:hypothetical protein DUNSADRAFT_2509 [Dunaliella salina]|eukprot:KAF5838600.1 hypothetical protein DUNSADRAFT_2509 [Dunaliella salina]